MGLHEEKANPYGQKEKKNQNIRAYPYAKPMTPEN